MRSCTRSRAYDSDPPDDPFLTPAFHQRYFFSLFMNIKLTARELPKNSDLTGEQLFSMCIEAEVPVDNWPKFISTHYFKNI